MRTSKKYSIKKSRAGLGMFAAGPIRKGELVAEYVGKLISNKEADEHGGRYLFAINSRWTIDGTTRKNIARYINHACRPNCEPEVVGHRIFIYAKRKINVGEEITYDYGKEYFDEFIQPKGCQCSYCRNKK